MTLEFFQFSLKKKLNFFITETRKFPELLTKLGNCEHVPPTDSNLTEEQRIDFGLKLKRVYFGDREPSFDTMLQYSDVCSCFFK